MKYVVTISFFFLYQVAAWNFVSQSINKFVARIEKILTHNHEFNSVLCPLNLHLGLSLLHQGAGGDTAQELSSLLGLQGHEQEITSSYKNLLYVLNREFFQTWTCMIPGENIELREDFVSAAYKYFKAGTAGASLMDYDYEAILDGTLKYCNYTGSMPRTAKLRISSKAIFFLSWEKRFPPSEEDDFILTSGEKVKTMMMTLNDVFIFKEDKRMGAKVLKLNYKDEDWSMLLVLPNSKEGLSSLQSKIAESPLTNLIKDLEEVKLEVSIPQFYADALNVPQDKFLEKLGVKKIFSNEADLNDVTIGGKMHLSRVLFEAIIVVDEFGTFSQATTDFLVTEGDVVPQLAHNPQMGKTTASTPSECAGLQSSTRSFKANHPFLFYIVGPGDVFVYSGKIVKPSKKTLWGNLIY